MFDELAEATGVVEELVRRLDPACLTAEQAVAGLDAFARAGRLCAAGVVLCSGRAAEARAHDRDGSRSAADWLAKRTGQSVGEAIAALEAARQAPGCEPLDEALRSGELSGQQAGAVAEAVAADPGCAEELVEAARREPLKRLRERARSAKTAAQGEAEAVASEEQLRERRYLRTFTGRDGAVRGEFALAPLDGARLLAAVEVEQRAAFEAARARGEEERSQAYAADALVALAERPQGDGRATPTLVLTADLAAFRRGATVPGETCEVAGAGPVPVATALSLLGEAFLKVVLTDGVDVASVTHFGRTVPAHLRTALQLRDPRCVVPGCTETRNLEVDHWRVPFAAGGPTSLDNLCRICRHHHRKKTHQGFVLDGGPGQWAWTAPRIFTGPPPEGPWRGYGPDHWPADDLPDEGPPEDWAPPGGSPPAGDQALALSLF